MVSGPTREEVLLNIYLIRSESSLISCNNLLGISGHNGILLEIGWAEIFRLTKFEKIFPLYKKTNILSLQDFLEDKFNL